MEKYLEEGDLSDDEILRGLRLASSMGRIYLVVPVAAAKLIGTSSPMDAAVDYLPSPKAVPPVKGTVPGQEAEVEREASESAPFSALVFKTTADPYVGSLRSSGCTRASLLPTARCLTPPGTKLRE